MRDRLNTLKGRELWRPLAPIGTADAADDCWRGPGSCSATCSAPRTSPRRARTESPRPCTWTAPRARQIADGAGFVAEVLAELGKAGADPVLINTSFNTRGEPIVNGADDAARSAEALGVDFLVVGDALFDRR